LNAANLERFPPFKEILINAKFHTVVMGLQDWMVKDVRPVLVPDVGAVSLFVC
jgi:hypothetical protein